MNGGSNTYSRGIIGFLRVPGWCSRGEGKLGNPKDSGWEDWETLLGCPRKLETA